MKLHLFQLLDHTSSVPRPGVLVWDGPHQKAKDAYEECFQIPEGHIILTTWHDRLHCVLYQTPARNPKGAARRNKELFAHYGDGFDFIEILDNGFGKVYRRFDQQRFALWSYAMDYATIGTMEFHAVKWG
jgi:hypothetical protein